MRDFHDSQPQAPTVGSILAGWRLVRQLPEELPGVASFVAVADAPPPNTRGSEHWRTYPLEAEPPLMHRRMNVATDAASCARLTEDARARHRLDGEFVRPRLELLTDGEHRLTISELAQDVPLATLVAERVPLVAGATLTLLVPILETILRAHERELSHGSLSLRTCRVDETGRPWVENWSASVDLRELPTMRRDLLIQQDLRAAGRICDAVLALSDDPSSSQVRSLVDALSQTGAVPDGLTRLIDALFAWTNPAPVLLPQARGRAEHPALNLDGPFGREETLLEDAAPAPRERGRHREPRPPLTHRVRRLSGLGGLAGMGARLQLLANWAGTVRPAVWLLLMGTGAAVALVSPIL